MLRDYLLHLQRLNYSLSMRGHSRDSIQKWALFLKKTSGKGLLEGNDRDLERYVLMLKSRYQEKTAGLYVTTLRRFYHYLKKEGLIFFSPFDFTHFKFKTDRLPKNIPAHEEVLKVLEHPDPKDKEGLRDHAILELIYSSGLRNGEICNLRVQDIDLKNTAVFVREGKWRRQRLLPMGKRATVAIRVYLKTSRPQHVKKPREDHLFLTIHGTPMSDPALRSVIQRHRVASPHTLKMTAHDLRHAMATQMLKHGSHISAVQEMLGHSRLSTTQIYTHLSPKDLSKVQEKHHPRSISVCAKSFYR